MNRWQDQVRACSVWDDWRNIASTLIFRTASNDSNGKWIESSRNL